MNVKTIFSLVLLFLSVQQVKAQPAGMYFSSVFCKADQKDSAFLVNTELKVWKAALDPGLAAFDNPSFDNAFRVRMTKAAVQASFPDSFPLKNTTSQYQLNLMENRAADTCYIMSCSPLIRYHFQLPDVWKPGPQQSIHVDTSATGLIFPDLRGYYKQPGAWTTGLRICLLVPLSEYSKALPGKEMQGVKKYAASQLAKTLHGQLNGDTLVRTVRFTCDSNEYLPQAPYRSLLQGLKNRMLSGEILGYADEKLSKRLTKMEIENACSGWDSTSSVEDPNNPGTFIYAPIKVEGDVRSLLVSERWIPFAPVVSHSPLRWPPDPGMAYKREVPAWGLYLDNGNTIWFSAAEVQRVLQEAHFNLMPYEECFRAERFRSLNIQEQ